MSFSCGGKCLFWCRLLITVLVAVCSGVRAGDLSALPDALVGAQAEHTVRKGESIGSISARLGVGEKALQLENGLRPGDPLPPGRVLAVDTRHIVPAQMGEGVLINIPQRMLFRFAEGAVVGAWPVALGKPSWPTPTGAFRIVSRERDKTWVVPPSIQEEMRREGKAVLTRVPPGPTNPLGRHWIGLSLPGYGIHGTLAPLSIYDFRSHGCIRMHPDDVAALFEGVVVGMPGQLIYEPALLARLEDGRIFAEVHRDAYQLAKDPLDQLRGKARAAGLEADIDWSRMAMVVKERAGVAREVGAVRAPVVITEREGETRQ